MRPTGPGCRASQTVEARGEEDQGLVDDHRYQARRAWVLQGGAVSVGDRGAAAPDKTGGPTTPPPCRVVRGSKSLARETSTVLSLGASGKNSTRAVPVAARDR